jgi:hypothetical protein
MFIALLFKAVLRRLGIAAALRPEATPKVTRQ